MGEDEVSISRQLRRRLEREGVTILADEVLRALAKAIPSYLTTYKAEFQRIIQQYPEHIEAFPPFTRGEKRYEIHICLNGVVLLQFPDKFQITTSFQPYSVGAAAGRITHGMIAFSGEGEIELADLVLMAQDNSGETRSVVEWDYARISTKADASKWVPELAQSKASADALGYLTAHLLHLPKNNGQPPAVARDAAIDKLSSIILDFETLLDGEPREEMIQQFLRQHTFLLCPTASRVAPKVKLGSEYVTDFVIEQHEPSHILVEIERADLLLFTKAGNPTKELVHAQRQVEDWRQWIHENLRYARDTMPNINDPPCWVILGRRRAMDEDQRRALDRHNRELKNIRVLTYDDLLDAAKTQLINLRQLAQSA